MKDYSTASTDVDNSTDMDAYRLFHDDMNDESSPELFGMYDYSVQGYDEVMDGSGIIDYNQNSDFTRRSCVCTLGESMRNDLLHRRFQNLDHSSSSSKDDDDTPEENSKPTDTAAGQDESKEQKEKASRTADKAPTRPSRPGLLSPNTTSTGPARPGLAEGVWKSMRSLATSKDHAAAPLDHQNKETLVRKLPQKSSSFKFGTKSKSLMTSGGDDTAAASPRRGVKKSSSFITNRFERTGIVDGTPRRGVKKSSSFITNRFERAGGEDDGAARRGIKKSSSFRFPGKAISSSSTRDDTQPAQPRRGVKKSSSFRFPGTASASAEEDTPEPRRGVKKASSFRFPSKALLAASGEDDERQPRRGVKKSSSFKFTRLVTPSA